MTSRAETPSKKALERLSQPSERCGSVNRICSAFQIARRWEMRSAVSRGRAPPSFFHLKNVERAGEPKRSEEQTSELTSLMRISYAVCCLKKKKNKNTQAKTTIII